MSGKVISAAILAAAFGALPAFADLRGPAELPPASYKGQQYVDSRGCVFLRAGYGGQVTWVPRVTRDRQQLCGYGPSGGEVAVAEAPAPAPAPKPAPAPAPAPKVAEAPAPAPKVVTAPAPKVAAAPVPEVVRPVTPTEKAATKTATAKGTVVTPTGGAGYSIACPADTPVAERFEVRGGGSKIMCTRGDGSLHGANFPRLVAGSTAGHAVGYDAHVAAGGSAVSPSGVAAAVVPGTTKTTKSTKSAKYPSPVPPPGYKMAWKDDRLNPNRGKQTVEGFMAMDDMWTRTTPSELREDSKVVRKKVKIIVRKSDGSEVLREGYVVTGPDGGRKVEVIGGTGVYASTKNAPDPVATAKKTEAAKKPVKEAPKAVSGKLLVQVGTFGVASNADGAAGKLKSMGLPVARGKAKGGSLQVIYAGPFASAAEAKTALAAARRAGFSDAVIVQ
ncbi:SPOR domain-containing protein [Neotabrizicola sp. VNH66]|uniref:SPOR domain-containing protein n=1 Tax=Neotabrizicola sp. VNH66 TaxID=3400918 RepID=UPI003BFD327C